MTGLMAKMYVAFAVDLNDGSVLLAEGRWNKKDAEDEILKYGKKYMIEWENMTGETVVVPDDESETLLAIKDWMAEDDISIFVMEVNIS